MRTLYLRPRLARALLRACCVVNVSPLLRELILHACTFAALKKTIQQQGHLINMIIDQLEAIPVVPLQLPNPSDPRALRVAEILLADPSDRRPLAYICKEVGASKRTVERLFQEDVGMAFGKWRQQLRLMQAMRLLAEGAKVTHAGPRVGLQYTEWIHFHVQENVGDHTDFVLQNRCKGQIAPSTRRIAIEELSSDCLLSTHFEQGPFVGFNPRRSVLPGSACGARLCTQLPSAPIRKSPFLAGSAPPP